MNKAQGDDQGGGGSGMPVPGQGATQAPQGTQGSQSEGGEQLDELGYPIPQKAPEDSSTGEKPGEKEPTDKTGTGYDDSASKKGDDSPASSTGYGDEPPKEDPPKTEDTPPKEGEEKPDDESGFKIEDKGDLLDDEVKNLTEFVKKHKLPKEAAEALVAERKEEAAKVKAWADEQRKKQEDAIAETRKQWREELKTDKDFGGNNGMDFDHNVAMIEKSLSTYGPELKKQLTENGTMLPPNAMRMLHRMAKELFGSQKLVNGDPASTKKEVPKETADKGMAFYEMKAN